MIRIPVPPLIADLGGPHPVARCCCHVFTPACPVDCLAAVMSTATFHALARAGGAPFDPPATAGHVLALRQAGRLGMVAGIGRRRLGEIVAPTRQYRQTCALRAVLCHADWVTITELGGQPRSSRQIRYLRPATLVSPNTPRSAGLRSRWRHVPARGHRRWPRVPSAPVRPSPGQRRGRSRPRAVTAR